MKILYLSITFFPFILVPILFGVAFGSEPCPASGYVHYGPSRQSIPCYLVTPQYNPTLEEQFGNSTKTKLVHDDAILILNQTTKKLVYQSGEEMTIIPELTNVGNKSVDIGYWEPEFFLEIKNQAGDVVWPQYTGIAYIPEFHGIKTLKPGEQFGVRPWTAPTAPIFDPLPIVLSTPGNYTVISVTTLTFDIPSQMVFSLEPLWSKPLQITVLPEKYVQNETSPVMITQVELDSPFALFPDNQTCTSPPKIGFANNCLVELIPGKKVQCGYFMGSSTCEPIHQYTGGTNKACLDPNEIPRAPQWFDIYNAQNKTIQIQLFNVQTLQNMKPWGEENLVPVPITLGPHEKCTYGFGPIDEPLTLDQTNMGFAVSYTYDGKNHTATTAPLTDLYNDSRTWQYDGNRWTFAEQNTITIPEFPFAGLMLLISFVSVIVFYRIKF